MPVHLSQWDGRTGKRLLRDILEHTVSIVVGYVPLLAWYTRDRSHVRRWTFVVWFSTYPCL